MYSSHTAELPGGDKIFFTDSGPIIGSNTYTTVVALHGGAFNGNTFRRLHSFASASNIRFIVMTRKDYRGSSPYTDEELNDLNNGFPIFFDRIAVVVANFIRYVIKTLDIPKVTSGNRGGGVSLLGWSIGVASILPLFSGCTAIGGKLYNELKDYVKDIILHDPPYPALGYELPSEHANVYNPWTDPQCHSVEDSLTNFSQWIGCYFLTPENWSGNINELDMRKRTEKSTLDTWDGEEMKLCYEKDAALRSELAMYVLTLQQCLISLNAASGFYPQCRP
ncbi:hypothetical protein BDQ17DRAFT_1253724 [Cyathus striatus]|nr:hypothetical protein BDQ17DRAFT_1253724 [Cyathus striatus]